MEATLRLCHPSISYLLACRVFNNLAQGAESGQCESGAATPRDIVHTARYPTVPYELAGMLGSLRDAARIGEGKLALNPASVGSLMADLSSAGVTVAQRSRTPTAPAPTWPANPQPRTQLPEPSQRQHRKPLVRRLGLRTRIEYP